MPDPDSNRPAGPVSSLLLALVGLPLAGALLVASLGRQRRVDPARAAALVAAANLGLVLLIAIALASGRSPPALDWPWVPALGVRFALRCDGLACLCALLVAIAGGVAVRVAAVPASAASGAAGPALALAAVALLQGLLLADDLVLLGVCWQAGALVTSLLVGATAADDAGRLGARLGAGVAGGGGLALLVGVLLIGDATGGYLLSPLAQAGSVLRRYPLYPLLLALVLTAACSRLVQWPLQAGVPARSPAAAAAGILHATTAMVAGLYLLLRLEDALGGTRAWRHGLALAAFATLLASSAAVLAGPERLLAGWRRLVGLLQRRPADTRPAGAPP